MIAVALTQLSAVTLRRAAAMNAPPEAAAQSAPAPTAGLATCMTPGEEWMFITA